MSFLLQSKLSSSDLKTWPILAGGKNAIWKNDSKLKKSFEENKEAVVIDADFIKN